MRKVTGLEKSTYGIGIAGQNIMYNFMSMYIMFFFTDLLGIPGSVATIIVVCASIWDAINDPIMGLLVDKTNTKLGKFRPYLIGGPILIFITFVLCYVCFNVPMRATIAIAAVTYILWGMSYTVCDIPLWALSSVVSDKSKDRNEMITLGKVGGTIGVVICVLFSVKLLGIFGGEREISAYTYSALIVGGLAAVSMILVGLIVKERIPPAKEKIPIKENIKTIFKNKSLVFLIISLFILNLINGIRQAGQMYFAVYTWGDANYITSVGISLVVGMLVGMLLAPKLMDKFEKKSILIVTSIFGAIVSIIPFIALYNVLLGLIFLGFSFAAVGLMTIVSTSMLLDAIDYSEWKLGFRGEGIVFSLNTFATKLSAAFAKFILGISLVIIHYTENQPITDTTVHCFSALMYIVPAICSVLTIIPLLFYKIDNKTISKIAQELKDRREIGEK